MRAKKDAMKDVGIVLDTKVYLEKRTVTSNEKKVQSETWSEEDIVYAQVNKLFGREYYAAKSLGEEKIIKFKMRKSAIANKLNTVDYRLKVKDGDSFTIYDITDTDPIPNSLWIVISAKAKV